MKHQCTKLDMTTLSYKKVGRLKERKFNRHTLFECTHCGYWENIDRTDIDEESVIEPEAPKKQNILQRFISWIC